MPRWNFFKQKPILYVIPYHWGGSRSSIKYTYSFNPKDFKIENSEKNNECCVIS